MAYKKGFAAGGSNVPIRHFFVNLVFVDRSEFSAENPARTQRPETVVYNFRAERLKPH